LLVASSRIGIDSPIRDFTKRSQHYWRESP
jgi:hypothetical protein